MNYSNLQEAEVVLPRTVYRQALYAVKDLERLRKKLNALKDNAYCLEATDYMRIATGGISDSTGNRASEIANVESRIAAIELAFEAIPVRYREGIEDKLVHDVNYNLSVHCINTWKKWQQVLLYHVAENLKLL